MGKNLQVFDFEGKQTRVVEINGEPWWVAKDVARALGYSESTGISRLFEIVPSEWKGVYPINTLGGIQDMTCLSEQGIYFFLGRSDKPKALPYQKFVAGEIMPSIRKHGAYMTPEKIEEVLLNPDTIINLAQALKQEQAKAKALETKIENDQSKVLFAESMIKSNASISMGEFAKTLRQHGYKTGLKRFLKKLHKKGYLMRDKRRYIPTQKSMELGLFEFTTKIVNDGTIRTSTSIRLTVRGQFYFINKFLGHPLKAALEDTPPAPVAAAGS
jgi:anti-repressor protein